MLISHHTRTIWGYIEIYICLKSGIYNANDFDNVDFHIAIAIADYLGRPIEGDLALILFLAEEQTYLASIYGG